MKFKSALITAASGSVGGMTASHNAGGLYLRARTIPVNPNTDQQQAVRNFMSQVTSAWSQVLTDAQRDAWNAYAAAVPMVDALGDQRFVTGLAMYTRSNIARLQAGLARIDAGPTELVLPTFTAPVPTLTAPDELSLAFTNTDDWAGEVGGAMIVRASRGTSGTINYFAGPYRYANKVAGAVVPPASPAAITLPFAVAAGQKVHLAIRICRADGRLSSLFRVAGIVEAA